MTLPAAEKATRTKTTATNNPQKAKSAPSPRQTRVTPSANPPIAPTKARVQRDPEAVSPRPGTKTAKVLALLKRPEGVGLKELLKATGWQPHSIRGFLSGTVVRRMGLKVRSTKAASGERRYAVKA